MGLLRASALIVAIVAIIGLYAPSSASASSIVFFWGTQGCGGSNASTVTCSANGTVFNGQAAGDLTTMRLSMDYTAVNNLGTGLDTTAVGGGVVINDSITVTGSTPGSTGTLRVNWVVSGTLAANGTGDITLAEFDYFGVNQTLWGACGTNNTHCASSSGPPVSETVSIVIPFVFGTPQNISFGLRGSTSGGSLDFYNTAQLQPLVVIDSSGNQVLGASVVSDSGFSYEIAQAAADLSVTKTDSPDPVIRGNNITYTVIVRNNGPSAATQVSLSDAVPSDTKFVSNSGAAGWSCSNPSTKGARTGDITCTKAGLDSSSSATFTIVVEVKAGTKSTTISNTAVVSSSTDDPNTGNNAATATTTIIGRK